MTEAFEKALDEATVKSELTPERMAELAAMSGATLERLRAKASEGSQKGA